MDMKHLNKLISKLDAVAKSSFEKAVTNAASRRHVSIEIEHWLSALLDLKEETDLALILREFNINKSHLEHELQRSASEFAKEQGDTAGKLPIISKSIPLLIQDAWEVASVEYDSQVIGSGHLLQALLENADRYREVIKGLPTLAKLDTRQLVAKMPAILRASGEEQPQDIQGLDALPNLEKFAVDLTALARADKIDPVIGRDVETQQVFEILLRRRQNNPIITGDAGVGKTAIAEGFALAVASGQAPEELANVSLWSLDLGSLKAGAGVRGEYENRIKEVIKEVKTASQPIILFIDEAHLLMGGGSSGDTSDASNLIKPELARGELRVIAATTWSDYKRYIEKDAALVRRFQVVRVREPSVPQAMEIMKGLQGRMEGHHKVKIDQAALESAVTLSDRYIVGRKLPDKAISVLDTACAHIRLKASNRAVAEESASPALSKTSQVGDQSAEQPQDTQQSDVARLVDADAVAAVVSGWTGIPVGGLLRNTVQTALDMERKLNQRVLGQPEALSRIVRQIKAYLARLTDRRKPMGAMFLVGTSGVGKTETAISLADIFFGGERNMITINMSEYQEAHTVSNLKGAPAGYVGYGEGGVLTEAVRRNPYSLVLLDELEKAHSDVIEMFYQVLDRGWMEDSESNEVDFSNCIVLMTSNAASDIIYDECDGGRVRPDVDTLSEKITPALQQTFKPAFLGRVQVIPYYPLNEEGMAEITHLKLNHLKKRFNQSYKRDLVLDEEVVKDMVRRCRETPVGARYIDNLITTIIQPRISDALLARLAAGEEVGDVRLLLDEAGEVKCEFKD